MANLNCLYSGPCSNFSLTAEGKRTPSTIIDSSQCPAALKRQIRWWNTKRNSLEKTQNTVGKHSFLFSFELYNKPGSFHLTWDLSQERAMSLTIPGSIVRCILLPRQEAGSPLPELTLACVEPVKVVCLPLLSICELSAFSDTGVTVLSSHPEKSCSPQDVISLLLFTCDVPEHINIHLPFYFSSLADSLAYQVWCYLEMFPLGILGTYLCSPFSSICLSHWFWVLLSKLSLSQISSLHRATKEVIWDRRIPAQVHGHHTCCGWSQAQLHWRHRNPTGLKIFVRRTLLQQKIAILTFPPLEVPNSPLQFR